MSSVYTHLTGPLGYVAGTLGVSAAAVPTAIVVTGAVVGTGVGLGVAYLLEDEEETE